MGVSDAESDIIAEADALPQFCPECGSGSLGNGFFRVPDNCELRPLCDECRRRSEIKMQAAGARWAMEREKAIIEAIMTKADLNAEWRAANQRYQQLLSCPPSLYGEWMKWRVQVQQELMTLSRLLCITPDEVREQLTAIEANPPTMESLWP